MSGVRDTTGAPVVGTVSRSLPADLSAVRQARDVVQRVLNSWRADEIFDDVVLVASELVANALRHGLQLDRQHSADWPPSTDWQPSPAWQHDPARPPAGELRQGLDRLPAQSTGSGWTNPDGVQISLVSTGSHVICAVTDPSPAPPIRQWADPFAGSGRGLQLVESLSLCWGWTLLDGDPDSAANGPGLGLGLGQAAVHGKSVWAIFPLDRRRPGGAVGVA